VSSRTYLSIGDVLSLLREEFPDVTISKIRFLESQGLVNPERSPSGYRKFFDHDVERLRWVLRQQREHFLPLKVIRDRLADGELGETDAGNGKAANGADVSASVGDGSGPEDRPTKADEEAMARILADASRRAARLPEPDDVRSTGSGATRERTATAVASAAGTAPAGAVTRSSRTAQPGKAAQSAPSAPPAQSMARGGARGGSSPSQPRRGGAGAQGAQGGDNGAPPASAAPASAASAATAAAPPPARPGDAGTKKGHAHAARGGAGANAAPAPSGMVTGASLTRDELCAATGLSPDEVAGLESFGLLRPVAVAGIDTYDEDALTLANLAAAFGAFGIEPRHLRMYRNAADRELGLIEQIVIPLLRQRNPEARQKAVEAAEQLAALGQSMRATLLHQALREHLGG
jgi:DNA-binding transcriptional MerR regulator